MPGAIWKLAKREHSVYTVKGKVDDIISEIDPTNGKLPCEQGNKDCVSHQKNLKQLQRMRSQEKARPGQRMVGFLTRTTHQELLHALDTVIGKSATPTERYTLGEMLGQGGSGSVYIARDNVTADVTAVKIIDIDKDPNNLSIAVSELEAMSIIKHENIVNYIGSHRVNHSIRIAMEYVDGDSLFHVCKLMELDGYCIATISHQCLKALQYIHSKRIIHRDIKSDNVLISRDGSVKLTDFGCCAHLRTSRSCQGAAIGTTHWMSPEALQGKPYDEKTDIWSMGIVIMEMLQGNPPYIEYSPARAYQKIVEQGKPRIPRNTLKELRNFIARCLAKKPARRHSAAQLLHHNFISQNALHPTKLVPLMAAVHNILYED